MKKVDYNSQISVLGAQFENVYEIIEDLAPMAYWGGDTNYQLILTDDMG